MRLVTLTGAFADTYVTTEDAPQPEFTRTTVQIPLTTLEERDAGTRLAQSLGLTISGLSDRDTAWMRPANMFNISANVAEYYELAKGHGYYYEDTFTLEETSWGATFDAKWIVDVSHSGAFTATQQRILKSTYWNGQAMVQRNCAA